jgi:hypothetical protein
MNIDTPETGYAEDRCRQNQAVGDDNHEIGIEASHQHLWVGSPQRLRLEKRNGAFVGQALDRTRRGLAPTSGWAIRLGENANDSVP